MTTLLPALIVLAVVFLAVVVLLTLGLCRAAAFGSRGEVAEVPGEDYYAPVEVRARSAAGIDELVNGRAEPTEDDREREYIADVLDDAHDALVSFFAADALGVDGEGCQVWMDRAWDRLRELDGDQRIRAVLMLLAADAQEGAKELSDVEGALR